MANLVDFLELVGLMLLLFVLVVFDVRSRLNRESARGPRSRS